MKSIITRLITVEDELRKEQREMAQVIAAKQQIIDERETKILNLDATNQRLLGALSQLREKYECVSSTSSTQTVVSSNSSEMSPKRVLMETAVQTPNSYKSSSC